MSEFSTAQLREDLARALSPGDFEDAAERSLTAFDELGAEVIAERGVTLACRAGCSLCCWLRVDAFAHEILQIVRHIHRHFTSGELAALRVRLAEHAVVVTPLTPFAHATRNVPCPLLHEGRCTVYAARPQACRRHHSLDFAACQFTFDHPTDLTAPAAHERTLFRALTEAMEENLAAYAGVGFDQTIYELGTALHEALNDPASWSRWRDREPAFLHASVTPAG